MSMNDINSLSHTKWTCKYHIVFAPKFCRKVFYQEKRAAIGKILRQLCEWKGVKIIEAEACPDHIHLFYAFFLSSTSAIHSEVLALFSSMMWL